MADHLKGASRMGPRRGFANSDAITAPARPQAAGTGSIE